MLGLLLSATVPARSDDTAAFTADRWYKIKPQELAALVGATDRTWVAETVLPAVLPPEGLGAAFLFATPEPVSAGVCQVNVLHVPFEPTDAHADPRDPNTRFRVGSPDRTSKFVVADSSDHATGSMSPADACRRTVIRTDGFKHTGADNVFDAPTPELASIAIDALASVIAAANGKKTMPFRMECDGNEFVCKSVKAYLAKLSIHDFESVAFCSSNDDQCVKSSGFDGHADWTLEITSNGDSRRIQRIRLTTVQEPVI